MTDAATAVTPAEIDTKTELPLYPETGSQIEIAERLRPQTVAVWIGDNDALGGALAYDQLDATQLTRDPAEQAIVGAHVDAINNVIQTTVAAHGMAVADLHTIYQFLSAAPFDFFGVTLSTRFLGGIFSLDGVHPSNTGHGLAAYFFIDALTRHYGLSIPQIDGGVFSFLVTTDPHIDHDGDGRVPGRFGAGLLETLLSILNIAGDSDDASGPTVATSAVLPTDEALSPSTRAE